VLGFGDESGEEQRSTAAAPADAFVVVQSGAGLAERFSHGLDRRSGKVTLDPTALAGKKVWAVRPIPEVMVQNANRVPARVTCIDPTNFISAKGDVSLQSEPGPKMRVDRVEIAPIFVSSAFAGPNNDVRRLTRPLLARLFPTAQWI
jgi:hypothetical protein